MFCCWLKEYTLEFARTNREVCVSLYRAGSSGQLRASRCCWGGLALFCPDWLLALTALHMIAGREARPLSLFLKEPFINYTGPAHSWVWTKSERGHGWENNGRRRWVVTDDVLAFRRLHSRTRMVTHNLNMNLPCSVGSAHDLDWYLARYYVASLSVSSSSHWRPSAVKAKKKKTKLWLHTFPARGSICLWLYR